MHRNAILPVCAIFLVIAASSPTKAGVSDDLWAKALFLSAWDTNVTAQKAQQLFLEALQKAEKKAPIYVSLGDYYSGPASMHQAVETVSGAVQEDFNKQVESLIKPDGKPSDAEIDKAARALTDLVNQSLQNHAKDLADALTGAQSQALRFYLAAIAEDPKCSVAWFRIAMNQEADAKLKSKAESNFINCDSKNALPHYLEAIDHLDRDQLPSAFLSVREGNCKTFTIPHSPMPQQFSLAFPNEKPYRHAGVAGKPISLTVLKTFVEGSDMFALFPLFSKFRNLARQLVKKGTDLKNDGNTEEAVRYLSAIATLGLKLAQSEERDTTLSLTGFAITALAAKDLRTLYQSSGQPQKVKKLDEFKKAKQQFHKEYFKFFKHRPDLWGSEEQILRNLQKIENHQKKEKAFVARLFQKTGLDKFSFDE